MRTTDPTEDSFIVWVSKYLSRTGLPVQAFAILLGLHFTTPFFPILCSKLFFMTIEPAGTYPASTLWEFWQLKRTPSCVSKQISTILHLSPCCELHRHLIQIMASAGSNRDSLNADQLLQTVSFICAILLNASLKIRLVRTLLYHLLPTKDYEFLHCFHKKWEINFPKISLRNGNVSILMQNFKKVKMLNIEVGYCSTNLNFFSVVSFPFYCYTANFIMPEMPLKGYFCNTELQNHRGWKGPLEITWSNLLLKQLPTAGYTGKCPGRFWLSPEKDTTASLASLFQCFISLTVKLSLTFSWKILCSSL